ncbi:hypothetical protein ACOSQ3_025408 [Xanthoceras sorbifolium]
MSSVAGVVSLNVGSIYGSTKGAMNQLAKKLACEWASDNMRANYVAPWAIKTPLAEPKATVEYSEEDFSFIMATNFESAYHLSQLAHPLLIKALPRAASIVFMSSVAGVVSVSVGSIYEATKGAVNQPTEDLACEWAKDNIRSNSIAP